MSTNSGIWVRLTFSSSTGEFLVDGDLFAVLGINSAELVNSNDPFSLLPRSVSKGLTEPKDIIRDDNLSLVIIPSVQNSFNSVTVISEKISDELITDIAGGVVAFSPDLVIVQWNKRMTYLFGPTSENAIGRKVSEVLPNPVLYNWSSVINSAHLGHEVRLEFVPLGGIKIEGILTQGGPGVLGLFRDSTESYQTSKQLRILSRLNQAYLQSSTTGLLLLDDQLRILHSNTGFSKLFQHKGSLIGLFLHEVISEESFQWIYNSSERLLINENLYFTEIIYSKNSDGSDKIIRQTLKSIRNEYNQNLNFVCIFEDETELILTKNKNKQLRISLDCLSDITKKLFHDDNENKKIDLFLEYVLKATFSKAVVLYMYDHLENLKLYSFIGSWPHNYPKKDPADYNFVSFAWSSDKIQKITKVNLGNLSKFFSNSLIVPVGAKIQGIGYLIFMDSKIAESDYKVFYTIASLVRAKYIILKGKVTATKDRLFPYYEELVPREFLDALQFPAAIIKLNGEIVYWNNSIEKVTGVKENEVSESVIDNLIDPEHHGISIDSLVFASSLSVESADNVWSVRRSDGSFSEKYMWTVKHVKSVSSLGRNPAFFLLGYPIHSSVFEEQSNYDNSKKLQNFISLFSATSIEDALNAVYSVCFLPAQEGVIEFTNLDNIVYLYPPKAINKEMDWTYKIQRVIFHQKFKIKIFGRIKLKEFDDILQLIKMRDFNPIKFSDFNTTINAEMQDFSEGLTKYLRKFSIDSIQQSNSILQFVDEADPLIRFAQTMQFSYELAAKVSHFLELFSALTYNTFLIENPKIMLPQIIKEFINMNLFPPTLSIDGSLNSVSVKSKVLLQSIGLLCQLIQQDEIILISVENAGDDINSGVVLKISNIEPFELNYNSEEVYSSLLSGNFDFDTEVAILLFLLKAAGCLKISFENKKLTLLLMGAL